MSTQDAVAPSVRRGARPVRDLVGAGVLATLGAVTTTTLVATLTRVAGVDFAVPEGGDVIPLSGIAVVTGFFSLVGVAIAVALRQWSARPAEHFVRTAIVLTLLSLVPPFLVGAAPVAVAALVGLHLVAASVMVPALGRRLPTG